MSDLVSAWAERIRGAAASGTPLCIEGGGSKRFVGREAHGEVLNVAENSGIVSYEPTELVVTARGGTPLAELEAVLAEQNQFLAFEPPHFGTGATLAGCVAAGLSGPRRASAGAVRDFMLGVKIVDGRGEVMSFGGQVMKNVAGYDVSRLIAGSLGTLGVILEVSLKVLPRPVAEQTLRFALDEARAIDQLNEWGGQPLPVSASAWEDGVLTLRLSGAEAAVRAACARLGGETLGEQTAAAFWQGLREQQCDYFADGAESPLWRLSLPSVAEPLQLAGTQLIEWGGAQRWLCSDAPAEAIRARAAALGGHATLFRGGDRKSEVFTPLDAPLLTIHRRLKAAFDPAGILNPGRLYQGI
ncbi:MAG: glycolate oxidase subunit GlcE [Betaproteobacteria bacterium HGW-Betaproteobacteria-13]|jgi:glycolate oxidase FAD binding subunit|uniref:Glycolate oxidase subunit GlcE n=1 Tax=Parazoarcus communis TaxID=41977 RepID=A0A2U8GXA3_9RHOO|nr:glycolate oxidase subunit GlcE [Parazoarcus communis]AWI78030.1 glycolate oxidase subunit GlcE [Parazoarcus communis]PKO57965.1 MAG: glycolate oxidase subunit GlcE [Betaproteobacteria bacterium HGW-Betaproteobacteria-19]PKO79497.1 MAG: glycolate oxidase subunit GlcE [Betaproteobacteria bacterium HGW-Betaproteobacteria-13]